MSWSTKRKLLYFLGAVVVVAAVASYFLYPILKEDPTCTDGKKNGDELGADCGGPCATLCKEQVYPVNVLWQRPFEVAPGVYDVLGYMENKNVDAGVPDLLYRFKLYDDKNVLVAERDGRTFVAPNQSSAIFESGIKTGERVPKRVFFDVEEGYNWVKTDANFSKVSFSVGGVSLTDSSTTPKLSANITNNSLFDLKNVEVVAILRDSEENAVAVSRTVIESLPKQTSKDVFFTWLLPFSSAVVRTEIIPRVNPFTVFRK